MGRIWQRKDVGSFGVWNGYYDLANFGFQIQGKQQRTASPLTNQSTIAAGTFGQPTTGGVTSGLPISNISGVGSKSLSNLQYEINQPTL